MAYEIKWTPPAKEDFSEIVDYLYDTWGGASAEKFTSNLEASLKNLEELPFLGKPHDYLSSVQELVLGKHYSLFYVVFESYVLILNITNSAKNRY